MRGRHPWVKGISSSRPREAPDGRGDNESEGTVLCIRLNRSERLNALDYTMIDQVLDALEAAAHDDGCRVVVLSGNGRAFCAGDDLKGMGEPTGPRWRGYKTSGLPVPQQVLIETLRTLPKPVVAAVHGYALGMGLDIALACDVQLCTDTAILGDHRAERALHAATGIAYQLPRIVGYGRALEMLLLAERITGVKAERMGLVYRAVPEPHFAEAVAAVVERFAHAATRSLAVIKEQVDLPYREAMRHSLALRATTAIEDQAEESQRSESGAHHISLATDPN